MKKISLKTIKDGLSRNEKRAIKGGSGSGVCDGYDCWYDGQCDGEFNGCTCLPSSTGGLGYCGWKK
ncbi:hypothetical protein [Aquimarina macrocephali]|uniref:hypothetical protein n=1 Tax=Aquimarina macrocephali TaxID=666563 RepID=UPI003F67B4F4